jgi:hypothetical protein
MMDEERQPAGSQPGLTSDYPGPSEPGSADADLAPIRSDERFAAILAKYKKD